MQAVPSGEGESKGKRNAACDLCVTFWEGNLMPRPRQYADLYGNKNDPTAAARMQAWRFTASRE